MEKHTINNCRPIIYIIRYISVLCFAQIILSSCAGPLFISKDKWKDKHIVYIKTNQKNVKVTNKKGEKLEQASDGELLGVYIDKLRPKNLKLTLSHPNRADTTINIKRGIRAGALFFDCTLGAALCGIPLLVDFANVNIYQVKKSSRILTVNMLYNIQYYEQKLYEAKQKGTIAAYEEFIKNYSESKLATKAQNSIYYLAWNDADSKNTITAYENFITKYPKATQVNEAQNKVYEMAYNEAVQKNTHEAFDNYITKYPNSPKLDIAKKTKTSIKEIDDAFANANKVSTYQAYKSFLDSYPKTKYTYQIAEKAANAYCSENLSELTNVKICNNVIKYVKDMMNKYSCNAERLKDIIGKRDYYIVEELKNVNTKQEYESFLGAQYIAESNAKEVNNYNMQEIKNRALGDFKNNFSGTFKCWDEQGNKEVVTYQNSKLNGVYTKYASDEKTVMEKGNYTNGNKNGMWTINFDNGKKRLVQNWENGNLTEETEFDENGTNLTEQRKAEAKKAEELRIAEEKRKEEEKLPKLDINYWVTKEIVKCSWCGKNYERIKTKFKNQDVMIEYITKKYGKLYGAMTELSLLFTPDYNLYDPYENYCSSRCKAQK